MKYEMLVVVAAMIAAHAAAHETNRSASGKPELGPPPPAQTNCPVMEGRPINKRLYVDYQGFRIYVCCIPCLKAVRKNPGKYLKKLQDQGLSPEKARQDTAPASGTEKAEKASQKQNSE